MVAGNNDITIVAFDNTGAQVSRIRLKPFYDDEPPVLDIKSPVPVAESMVTVVGQITDNNPDAELVVLVDGIRAQIDENGDFSAAVEVSDEAQTVTVVASDGAQRISQAVPIAGRGADNLLPPPPPPLPGGGHTTIT